MFVQRTRSNLEDEWDLPIGHGALVAAARSAIEKGDVALLREALFEAAPRIEAGRERRVLRPGVARALIEGMEPADPTSDRCDGTFAQLCFRHGRADMLREVLECVRPPYVRGNPVSDGNGWMETLCRRDWHGTWVRIDLAYHVGVRPQAHSREFMLLILEFAPDAFSIGELRSSNAEAGALITDCEMALRIGLQPPQPPVDAGQTPPARARHRRL